MLTQNYKSVARTVKVDTFYITIFFKISITLAVPVKDVYIINQPNQTQYDRKTDNITLTCTAIGDPEPKFMWFKGKNNNTVISWTNQYVIEDVIQNNSGVYTCKAYNIINNVYYSHSNTVEINIGMLNITL